jgi:hypothetical protein
MGTVSGKEEMGAIAGGAAVCNVSADDSGVNLAKCDADPRWTICRSEIIAARHRKPLLRPSKCKTVT